MPKKTQPLGVNMSPCETKLGAFLRERRLALGLTQVAVAGQLEIEQGRYCYYELRGKNFQDPSMPEKLALVLQCDVQQIHALMPKKYQKNPQTKLGKMLFAERKRLGLNREDFALATGLPATFVHNVETGLQTTFPKKTLEKIALTLGKDLSTLTDLLSVSHKETTNPLGQLIRTHRRKKALTLKEAADKVGITRQRLSQIEFKGCSLESETFLKLAEVLGFTIEDATRAQNS